MRRGFDAGVALTWNAEETATYETGYKEGGYARDVDWSLAFEQAGLSITSDPEDAAALIAGLFRKLATEVAYLTRVSDGRRRLTIDSAVDITADEYELVMDIVTDRRG